MTLLDGAAEAIAADSATLADEPAAPPLQWQRSKGGKDYVRVPEFGPGFAGNVWRKGDETIEQAIERRRAGPKDKAPRSRKQRKAEDRPPVDTLTSKSEVTRQIAEMMADVLCSPSMPCAAFGMEWEAQHYDRQGRLFAQNIARSSERNPWLRAKLEQGLSGEQNVIAWITSLNLATGAVGYFLPPLIKWGIVPATDNARMMFGLPPTVYADIPPQGRPQESYRPPVTEQMAGVAAMFEQMANAEQTAGPPNAEPPEPPRVS